MITRIIIKIERLKEEVEEKAKLKTINETEKKKQTIKFYKLERANKN